MNFVDVIKKSVLEKFQIGDLTTTSIAITLGMAILLGLFVYFIYRLHTKSGFYSRGFNKTLAVLPVITATIMLAMGSSLTISLGMVGALSIVRFRNAVKEPVDLMFLFWSISIGIVVGAGLFELAILLSLAVAVLIFALDLIPSLKAPCLLVVSGESADAENALLACAKLYAKAPKIRSRNITKRGVEWIVEMQVKNEKELVEGVAAIETIQSVQLMTHDGDVRF